MKGIGFGLAAALRVMWLPEIHQTDYSLIFSICGNCHAISRTASCCLYEAFAAFSSGRNHRNLQLNTRISPGTSLKDALTEPCFHLSSCELLKSPFHALSGSWCGGCSQTSRSNVLDGNWLNPCFFWNPPYPCVWLVPLFQRIPG